MLCQTFSPKRWVEGFPAHVQPKLNGVRALYQNGEFWSRDEIKWHPNVVNHFTRQLDNLFEPSVILDGEFYLHGLSLQQINGAMAVNSKSPTELTFRIEYHVFDAPNLKQNFISRFSPIAQCLDLWDLPNIKSVPFATCYTSQQADAEYTHWVKQKYEGIIYKLGECPYTTPKQPGDAGRGFISDKENRVWHQLKRKDWHDDDFFIVGVVEGKVTDRGSKYVDCLGAFICRDTSGNTFNVGSGFSDADRIRWWAAPPIGLKMKVKYLTLTDRGVPFNGTCECVYE